MPVRRNLSVALKSRLCLPAHPYNTARCELQKSGKSSGCVGEIGSVTAVGSDDGGGDIGSEVDIEKPVD